MLDVQRYRGATCIEEITYTRRWMWTHMILGAVLAAVFLFHEVFRWFAGTAAWYGVCLLAMYGFMMELRICRVLLALLALGAAGAGVFFINRVFPLLEPPRMNLIPQAVLSVLVGLAAMVYAVMGLVLLLSKRVRRAGRVGFSLW